jgi:hypothetical protein
MMGQILTFGAEPRVSAVGSMPVFEDDWLIPEDQWRGLAEQGCGDLSAAVRWVLNQNPRGWCWAFGACGGVMAARILMGHEPELLLPDAAAVYLGQAGGYPIDWTLTKFVMPVGFPPATVAPKFDPLKYGSRLASVGDMASNWRDLAAQRKPLAAKDCPSIQHVVSAVFHGWPVEAGIFWQDSRLQGHALLIVAVVWRNGQWYAEGPNSWGSEHRDPWFPHPTRAGWFAIPLAKWDIETFGAFAILDSTWSPSDVITPPLQA